MVLDKFSNAINVFKTSFSFIKKDKSLIAVPILMLVSNLALVVLFILSILFGSFTSNGSMIVTFIFLVLLGYFINALLSSAQSWMVYEVAKGKNTTLSSGLKRAMYNFKDVLFYSIVSFFITIIVEGTRGHKERQGIIQNIARESIASTMDFVSRIAKKLTIPAMIITEMSFGQAVKSLKNSLKAAPEILIFEVGIGPLTGLFTFLFFLLGFLLIWAGWIWAGIIFLAGSILLISLLSLLINQIYYTLVYIILIEKKKVKGISLK